MFVFQSMECKMLNARVHGGVHMRNDDFIYEQERYLKAVFLSGHI